MTTYYEDTYKRRLPPTLRMRMVPKDGGKLKDTVAQEDQEHLRHLSSRPTLVRLYSAIQATDDHIILWRHLSKVAAPERWLLFNKGENALGIAK